MDNFLTHLYAKYIRAVDFEATCTEDKKALAHDLVLMLSEIIEDYLKEYYEKKN